MAHGTSAFARLRPVTAGWVGEVAQARPDDRRAGGQEGVAGSTASTPLYERRLKEVLLDREVVIAGLLRRNHIDETRSSPSCGRSPRPAQGARPARGKSPALRRAGVGVEAGFIDWGDFRRLEPVSGCGEATGAECRSLLHRALSPAPCR